MTKKEIERQKRDSVIRCISNLEWARHFIGAAGRVSEDIKFGNKAQDLSMRLLNLECELRGKL